MRRWCHHCRDHGAKGDNVTDDTGAFLRALAAMPPGALLVPAGTYRITQKLVVGLKDVVIQGEGPGMTTIFFPHSLTQVWQCGDHVMLDNGTQR